MMPLPSLSFSSASSATAGNIKTGKMAIDLGNVINTGGSGVSWKWIALGAGALLVVFLLLRKFGR